MYPQKQLTSSSAEVSGEYIYSDEAYNILSSMQGAHNEYTFCFAKINNDSWEGGYEISATTPTTSTSVIKKYFNGFVKVDLSTETNANATMSVTITGSGAVSDTVPTNIKFYGTN